MKVFVFRLFSAFFAAGSLCSCNVPETPPTATPTPEITETPVKPVRTATPLPTPTATNIPEYLSIGQSGFEGTEVILRYSLDGSKRDRLEELIRQFNRENSSGITIRPAAETSMDAFIESVEESSECEILISGSDILRNLHGGGSDPVDLSGFLELPELKLDSEEITPIMPVMLRQEEQDGKYFALPLWAEPAFLFYNKTWALELGFQDTPADLAAFAEQACAAGRANYADKDDGKHGTGGWIVSSDTEDVVSWLLTFALTDQTPSDLMKDEKGEAFSDTAAWLRNLYDNGCAWVSRVKEPYDYFANRYALFYSGTYSDANRQLNAFGQSDSYGFDNWDLITYPVKNGGAKTDPRIYGDIISVAVTNGDAKQVGAAWQFIRWLYSGTHAAELSLEAGGWPVQDNAEITRLYRNSGKDKLYQTLSHRQYLVPNEADENWLTDQLILADGFAYIFNPSASAESIPAIWEQIQSAIAEINSVTRVFKENTAEDANETGEIYENEP